MSKNIVTNCFKHIKLVSKHKWLVFKFCCKVGIPFRGLVHDLSKFSPEEFIESIKYYDGTVSPITKCKKANGYSRAWLHHKGRNKHHLEYWLDLSTKVGSVPIPYKYMAEMVCDRLSASVTYNGKNWTNASAYEYWRKEKNILIINPKMENFLEEVFLQIKNNGVDKTLNKKNLKEIYKKYCIDDKTEYVFEFHGEWKKNRKGMIKDE